MTKIASRKVKKLMEQQYAAGFVHGLKAAAEQKSIADVRKLAAKGQEALRRAALGVEDKGGERLVTVPD